MTVAYRWLNGVRYDAGEHLPSFGKRSDLSTPQIAGDYETYECPVTGKPIEGRAAHRENLKRHGCRLLEKGETREAPKRREESLNASIDSILKD